MEPYFVVTRSPSFARRGRWRLSGFHLNIFAGAEEDSSIRVRNHGRSSLTSTSRSVFRVSCRVRWGGDQAHRQCSTTLCAAILAAPPFFDRRLVRRGDDTLFPDWRGSASRRRCCSITRRRDWSSAEKFAFTLSRASCAGRAAIVSRASSSLWGCLIGRALARARRPHAGVIYGARGTRSSAHFRDDGWRHDDSILLRARGKDSRRRRPPRFVSLRAIENRSQAGRTLFPLHGAEISRAGLMRSSCAVLVHPRARGDGLRRTKRARCSRRCRASHPRAAIRGSALRRRAVGISCSYSMVVIMTPPSTIRRV